MYAARYIGNGTLEVVETSPAEPSAGEVQLDVAYTGICGTDLHILHGAMDARVSMPAVLGHEMAGRVASIGEGVEGWQIGDAADRHAARLVRRLCRVRERRLAHLLPPELPGHRRPGLDAIALERPGVGARPPAR